MKEEIIKRIIERKLAQIKAAWCEHTCGASCFWPNGNCVYVK